MNNPKIEKTLKSVFFSSLLESKKYRFDIPIPESLKQIIRIFSKNKKECFLVGGAVRDAIMGKAPKDYDICTNAHPDDVIKIMKEYPQFKLLEVGKQFGVIIIVDSSGEEFECATYRKDIGSGRRPDAVEFTTIENDVLRRDLTINSLVYDPIRHEIVDYVGGIDDIKNNVVRTVGNPDQRFAEDRLRVLRAFRFAGRLHSKLDPATAASIKNDNSLSGVSPERIRDEFLKGIKSAKSVIYFLNMLNEFDMFLQIFPGLEVNKDFEETRNVPVQLALLLRMNDPIVLAAKLNSLKYSADEVSQITFLVDFGNSNFDMPILRMKKSYKNSRLSNQDLLEYCSMLNLTSVQMAEKFLSFEITVKSADLMNKGFSGKSLGDEMVRLEQLNWIDYIH